MRYWPVVFLLIALVISGKSAIAQNEVVFATTPGTGPDKWASVWLLRRHVNPDPVLLLESSDKASATHTLFDAVGAPYDRTGSNTTYSALMSGFSITSPIAQQIGQLVQEIEIDAWRMDVSLASRVVEQGFRSMQIAHGRELVTQECYLRFFDRIANALDAGTLESIEPSSLHPEVDCLDVGPAGGNLQAPGQRVGILPLSTLMRRIGDGENVVFIDTRERWEYNEGHIPGAINLKLRDINAEAVALHSLDEADLVIAYCVKDFRGYEVAKALQAYDVPASVIKPHGMRGWLTSGLPISGADHLNEDEGMNAVRQLARESDRKTTE